MKTTIYTAVGHLTRKRSEDGTSYPVILLNRREYGVDVQEMAVWAALCWEFLTMDEIRAKYAEYTNKLPSERRTLEDCVARLKTRGLIAFGCGESGREALYDLLADLYVVKGLLRDAVLPTKLTVGQPAFPTPPMDLRPFL